jgi:hypothetical protein
MRRQPRGRGPAAGADRAVEWPVEHAGTRGTHWREDDGQQRVGRADDGVTRVPRRRTRGVRRCPRAVRVRRTIDTHG